MSPCRWRSRSRAAPARAPVDDLTGCALMGTVVSTGTADGVVVATGGGAEFGRIALGLGERQPETDFQAGSAPVLGAARCTWRWR